MTQILRPPQRQLTVIKTLLAIAILAALSAATAGLILVVTTPEDGSTTEGLLGFTAAAGGITGAVCAGVAAVYAQIKNMWRYAPGWVRAAAWVVLVAAALSTLWGSSAMN